MNRINRRRDIWSLFSIVILVLYIIFLIYPMGRMFKESIVLPDGSFGLDYFARFLGQRYYNITLWNSTQVTVVVTILTMLLGVPFAYFYTMYELKGARILQVLAILCSMSPPFIGAYAWIQLFGRSGTVTTFLSNTFGITLPSIYGFNGIVIVITLQLFPLVFLYMVGALRNIDNSLIEAAENLGLSGYKRFFKIIIPLTMPTVLAAALLVFMRAFADFGTPLLIGEGFRVFPVEIYRQYLGETSTNNNFAAAISIIGVIITAVFFLIQKWTADRHKFTMSAMNTVERKKPKPIPGLLMHIYCYGLVGLAFMPQLVVLYQSFRKTSGKLFVEGYTFENYSQAMKNMWKAIPNTLIIGLIALVIIVLLAIIVAYLVVRRSNITNQAIDTISMLPYILPGAVVGIALLIAFSDGPLILTGTSAIMVIALCIRRLPYTVRSSVAILQQIPMSIEEAAISLGTSKMKTFFTITVPMMSKGILSGAILSWVTIITELSTGIILYNTSTITLTLAIYTYVTRGNYGIASALATILLFFTTVSLFLFMRVSKGREFEF